MSRIRQSRIEQWILDYGLHNPVERRRVEEFVQENPEWEACLVSAQQWMALLDDARKLNDPAWDDEHLPYAVASASLPHTGPSNPIRRALERLFLRTEGNPERRAMRYIYASRRKESEAMTSVEHHFQEVTGHQVREAAGLETAGRTGIPARDPRRFQPGSRTAIVRQVTRALGMVAGVYLMLFIASTYRDAPFEQMAHLTVSDLTWTRLGVTARGNDAAWERVMSDRYNEALDAAGSSRKSFLGLFPSYRASQLRRSMLLLEESIAFQLAREPVPAHAYLTLSKLHFLLGDSLRSLDALREVIERNTDRVQEPERPEQLF